MITNVTPIEWLFVCVLLGVLMGVLMGALLVFGWPYGCSYGPLPTNDTCFPKPHMKSPQAAQNTGSVKAYRSGNWLMWKNAFCSPLERICVRSLERTFPQLHVFSQKSSDLPPRAKSQEPNIHLASLVALVSLPCDIIICDINAFKFDFEILYSNIGNHIQNILGMSFKLK